MKIGQTLSRKSEMAISPVTLLVGLFIMSLFSPSLAVSISVDGNPSDWAGITPLITDVTGNASPDSPEDFINLYVTNDETFVYFLVEYANAIRLDHPGFGLGVIHLDTDRNPSTGCPIFAFPGEEALGAEFTMALDEQSDRKCT